MNQPYAECVVEATIKVKYRLPADLAFREKIYGTPDAVSCVLLDLNEDPAAFFADVDAIHLEVVQLEGGKRVAVSVVVPEDGVPVPVVSPDPVVLPRQSMAACNNWERWTEDE